MTGQTLYSFAPKGDHLTLYKGKKKVHTPNGNVVIANTKALAQRIVDELTAGADYTSCATTLCYHYTYCDLIAQYDTPTVADDLQTCLRENLIEDPLLFFRDERFMTCESSENLPEIEEDEAQEVVLPMLKSMSELINGCSIYQLVAIIVLYCSFESLALSWYIINAQKDSASKDAFIADLRIYCEKTELPYPKNINEIMAAFEYYFQIEN